MMSVVDQSPVGDCDYARESDRLIPQSPENLQSYWHLIVNLKLISVMKSCKDSTKACCYHCPDQIQVSQVDEVEAETSSYHVEPNRICYTEDKERSNDPSVSHEKQRLLGFLPLK